MSSSPETTWRGFTTLPSDLVDILIEQCDENGDAHRDPCNSSPTLWLTAGHNPFGVFTSAKHGKPTALVARRRQPSPSPPSSFPPSPQSSFLSLADQSPPWTPRSAWSASSQTSAPVSLARSMVVFPDATDNERFLFHHYVSHVSDLMVPYEHPWNPWKRMYPAAALHQRSPFQKALHSAILSHAAFNVAHLRGGDGGGEPRMLDTAARIYGTALQQLVPHIMNSQGEFSEILAAVMSLMFAEVYSGESHSWRRHFKGAWMIFERYRASEPWKFANMACLSLQSLIIVKIIGATSAMDDEPAMLETLSSSSVPDTPLLENADQEEPPVQDGPRRQQAARQQQGATRTMQQWSLSQSLNEESPKALAPILFSAEFGFTIGAPRVVLQCIASITDFRFRRDRGLVDAGAVDDLLQMILARLNAYRSECEGAMEIEGRVVNLDQDGQSLVGPLPPRPMQIPPEALSQRKAFLYATYVYLYRVLLNASPEAVQFHVRKTFCSVTDFFAQTRLHNFSIWPAFVAAAEAYAPEDMDVARRWLEGAMTFGSGNRHAVKRVLEEVWRRRAAIASASGADQGTISVDWRRIMHELDCDVLIV